MVRAIVVAAATTLLALGGSFAAWTLADNSRRNAAFTVSVPETFQTLETQPEPGPRLTSPSGEFDVAVTDSGITWKGPGGSIRITPGGVTLKSSAKLTVQGAGIVTLGGAQVKLCGSGGTPIARVGDLVDSGFVLTPGGPIPRRGPIIQGSKTVLAC